MSIYDGFEQHHLTKTESRELIRRYWPVVLGTFVAGTLAMYIALPLCFTDMYESNARLLVKVGRENVETPPTVQNGQVFSQGVRVADINSEVQILSARGLIESVVDKLGPDAFRQVMAPPQNWTGYPKYYAKQVAHAVKRGYREFLIGVGLQRRLTPREDVILSLAAGVKVEPVRDSDILVLHVRTPSPKLSMDVAIALLDAYLQRRMEIRRAPAGSEFFEARLSEARDRLSKLQVDRAGVRTKWNLVAPDEQRSMYLKQLSGIETELVQNESEIRKYRRQQELMTLQLRKMPELVRKEQVEAANPSIQPIKERIAALQVERAKLASRYKSGTEVMNKMDAEIADLNLALNRENPTVLHSVTSEPDPLRREFRVGIEHQTVQVAGLETQDDYLRIPEVQLRQEARDLNRGIDAMEGAEREYRRAEQDYLSYSKRLEEARMSEALDFRRIANVALVEPPETPIEPASPRKLFLMGISMAVSLILGLALAALLETTEDRILDERSVFALGDLSYFGTLDFEDAIKRTNGHSNGHGNGNGNGHRRDRVPV